MYARGVAEMIPDIGNVSLHPRRSDCSPGDGGGGEVTELIMEEWLALESRFIAEAPAIVDELHVGVPLPLCQKVCAAVSQFEAYGTIFSGQTLLAEVVDDLAQLGARETRSQDVANA